MAARRVGDPPAPHAFGDRQHAVRSGEGEHAMKRRASRARRAPRESREHFASVGLVIAVPASVARRPDPGRAV